MPTPADELHTAAAIMRTLPGPAAEPIAKLLEAAARQEAYTLAEFGHRGGAGPHALDVARAINTAGTGPHRSDDAAPATDRGTVRAAVLDEVARRIAADAALRETEGEYALAQYGWGLARSIQAQQPTP